jgi:hypothetical protein
MDKQINLWLKFHLSAIANTIPGTVSGRISPENLGSVISNKASATCNTQSTEIKKRSISKTERNLIHEIPTKKREKVDMWKEKNNI